MAQLLGEHQGRVVVAALAAVLLGLVEPEEAELAHPLEHPVGEGRLLPLLGVGLELLDREAADRVAKLLVLVGEDEVLALCGEVGLENVGGGGQPGGANSKTFYLLLLGVALAERPRNVGGWPPGGVGETRC